MNRSGYILIGGYKMELQINRDDLYIMLKKAVREVLEEERFDFILKNLS